MKKEKFVVLIVVVLFVFGAGVWYYQQFARPVSTTSFVQDTEHTAMPETSTQNQETPEICAVYICGAIQHAGVYRFTHIPRVCDVIEAAGGVTSKADISQINQAGYAQDGEQITIPVKSKSKKRSQVQETTIEQTQNDKVNINTATKEQLMTLTGIGEAKALSILQYREENGSFHSPEDIMQISGIKEGVYSKIKDKITV